MNILSPVRKIILKGKYQGEEFLFNAEIATPSVSIDIDIAKSKRLQGIEVSAATEGYVFAVKTLDHVVKSLPEGFPEISSFEEIDDPELIVELFNDYDKKEKEFHRKLKKNRDPRSPRGTGDNSRPIPNEGVPPSTRGSEFNEGSLSETKSISTGSNVADRLLPVPGESESLNEKRGNRNATSPGVTKLFEPQPGSFPGTRSRVFKGNASA